MKDLVLGDSLEALMDYRGKTPKKLGTEFRIDGVPVVSAQLVANGVLNLAEARYVTREAHDTWMSMRTRRGDVLLTSEAPLGRVARVPSDEPLVLGQRLFGLRGLAGELDTGFLYYALQSERVQADLVGRSTGSTVFGIRQSALRRVVIPAPTFPEQCAIAEVLGALDDKIAANEQVAKTAIELGNSLFDRMYSESAVTRTQLGELVGGGGLVLGDGYRTKRSEHGQPGLRILRAGDVHDSRIDPVGDDFVSQSYARQIGPKMSQSGDIVMTTKGTVGRVAVVSSAMERLVYSPQLCYFRVVDNGTLDRGYLATWFRGSDLQYQASLRMFKSDMAPYINLQDIRSLEVPIVPFEQQRRQGETQLKLLELFDGANAENTRLVRVRDALLPQLMSGKIRVRDAVQLAGSVV